LRFLLTKLPRRPQGDGYHFENEVDLQYYRLQKISEGSIDLSKGDVESLKGPTEVGTKKAQDEKVQLSLLVDKLNERFGTDFNKADELFFDQVTEAAVLNEKICHAAKANTMENFNPVFEKILEGIFIERMEGNEEIFTKLMNDDKFKELATKHLVKEVYQRIRSNNN
jgi:type I restriction enzyme R subunit